MEARKPETHGSDPFPLVNAGVVPEDDDMPAKVTEQVSKEGAHLVVPNVLLIASKVQTDGAPPWTDRDPGDYGYPVALVVVREPRSDTPRRPRLPQRRYQEEARLVREDDVGTQPCCVFFTRGHSLRFQRSIFSSSRSAARRSGFW